MKPQYFSRHGTPIPRDDLAELLRIARSKREKFIVRDNDSLRISMQIMGRWTVFYFNREQM